MALCTGRQRGTYCPNGNGGYNPIQSVTPIARGTRVNFNASAYFNISTVRTNNGFAVNPWVPCETKVVTAFPWWDSPNDYYDGITVTPNGAIGDILPDDVASGILYELTRVFIRYRVTRDIDVYSGAAHDNPSHSALIVDSDTLVHLSDSNDWFWDTAGTGTNKVKTDVRGIPGANNSECWTPDPFSIATFQGATQRSSFSTHASFNICGDSFVKNVYKNVVATFVEAWYEYDTFAFTCPVQSGGGGGGGGGGGDGTPLPSAHGVDLLAWKEGYHIAECQTSGNLRVSSKWHHDMTTFDSVVTVDSAADCFFPCLSHPKHVPPLGLLYSRGKGQTFSVYRKESMDYGRTWKPDPAEGQAFKGGGVKHCREVYNERTGQRVMVYNDATDKNADNTLSGKGKMQAAVYGAETDAQTGRLMLKGTYKISDDLADDASFGLLYVEDDGAIDCVFYAAGNRRIFRSYDDGVSWKEVS